MKSKGENRKKKPYRPPRLVTYGDFRSLTRHTAAKGGTNKDGGNPQTKL